MQRPRRATHRSMPVLPEDVQIATKPTSCGWVLPLTPSPQAPWWPRRSTPASSLGPMRHRGPIAWLMRRTPVSATARSAIAASTTFRVRKSQPTTFRLQPPGSAPPATRPATTRRCRHWPIFTPMHRALQPTARSATAALRPALRYRRRTSALWVCQATTFRPVPPARVATSVPAPALPACR